GVAALAFQTTTTSLIQLRSEPALRGRVMALYSVVFLGTTPIGAPTVGWVAQHFGPRAGLALGGAAVLVAALTALWLGARRHVFEAHTRPLALDSGDASTMAGGRVAGCSRPRSHSWVRPRRPAPPCSRQVRPALRRRSPPQRRLLQPARLCHTSS